MHYIILGKYTEQGVKGMKDLPKRLEQAKEVAKSFGGEIKQYYLTMGRYDFVVIAEAPNIEAVMKALLTVGAGGDVRTPVTARHLLRALFSPDCDATGCDRCTGLWPGRLLRRQVVQNRAVRPVVASTGPN